MRVDDQGAPTGAPTEKVVACVANDQAKVVVASKVDSCLYVRISFCRDDVDAVVAQGTGILGVCRRAAGFIGEVGPELGDGIFYSGRPLINLLPVSSKSQTYCHCSLEKLAVTRAHSAAPYVVRLPKGPLNVAWHGAPGGTAIARLPSTVLLSLVHAALSGQQASPG